MQKRWIGLLLCFVVAATVSTPGRAEQAPAEPETGWVVVKYAMPVRAAMATTGYTPTLAEDGYRRLPVPAGLTAEQYAEDLRGDPEVLAADPDVKVFAADAPNDPYYTTEQSSYLAQIGAPAAWNIATGTGTIVVAVLDTGLDLRHEEFAGRLWENTADAGSDGIDRDGNGCINDRFGCRFVSLDTDRERDCGYASSDRTGAVMDDHGKAGAASHSHGTMVAGVIGAAGNNGAGITGVAWNVKLMIVKVLDCGTVAHGGLPSGDMFNVAEGIRYAQRMGANIINLSLASQGGDQKGDIPALRDAVQSAQNAGIIIVAAAGNYGSSGTQPGPGYPAAYTQYQNVVAVGSSDNLNGNAWASYSAYGPALDLAAPGNNIASTTRTDLGKYGKDKGTSYSTPIVTGMFALMMGRNSGLAPADYIQLALATATPAPPAAHGQSWAGAGIANIGAAVARVPMVITGNPMHDWKDRPPGTEVRATIDGFDCGSTTAFGFGPVTRFGLRVKSAGEATGCGAPGKVVQILLAGTPAAPTFTWGGLNVDLSNVNKEVTTISPSPGAIVVQPLGRSWSNIGHLDAPGTLPGALSYLPNSWTGAMKWDPDAPGDDGPGQFLRSTPGGATYVGNWKTIQTYDAMWVDAAAANVATLNPAPAAGRVVQLRKGWNNFVYTGSSRAMSDGLSDIAGKYSQVMQYDNVSGTWLSHIAGRPRYLNDFSGILKLQVYWILMSEAGTLTMR